MKKYKKMTQFLVSKKLRHVIFFYLLRNHGEEESFQNSVLMNRVEHIGRACRAVDAGRAEKRRYRESIDMDGKKEYVSDQTAEAAG